MLYKALFVHGSVSQELGFNSVIQAVFKVLWAEETRAVLKKQSRLTVFQSWLIPKKVSEACGLFGQSVP